jgi:hypothetical protein
VVELSLAAMVDMMINLLIFLLHLYGRGAMITPASDDMQLAGSTASEPLQIAVAVAVSHRAIEIGGKRIVELEEGPRIADGMVEGGAIGALTEAIARDLQRQASRAPPDAEKTPTETELLVQTDRRTPWSVLGPVLRSAAAAGVDRYRFVVLSESAQTD